MKKKLLISIVSLLLILALFAGCGGGGGASSPPNTLRAYMDANPSEWATLVAEMEADGAAMADMFGVEVVTTLEIEGDHTMLTSVQFLDPAFTADTEIGAAFAAGLQESLDEMAFLQEEMAREIREAMGIDTFYSALRYLDAAGDVLAERTFAGQ